MRKIISLINHKGGVGKTTLTFNLAHGLADSGYKVLAIDSDPQGNLSQCFGAQGTYSLLDFYKDKKGSPSKVKENLDLLSSNLELEEAEHKLNSKKIHREGVLKKLLELKKFNTLYDFILIDCPPSLNIITTNAIVASDGILIPVKPEFLPYEGLGSVNNIIREIQTAFNPDLSILGVVFNDVRTERVLTKEVIEKVKHMFGDVVFEVVLRNYVAVAESPISNQSVMEYNPGSNAALDFKAFIEEFENKVKK